MFNKKTGSILSGPRLLIGTMIASVSFILSVEGALAVYKYDNEEKDTHLWLVGIAEGEAEYLTLEGNIEPVEENELYESGYSYDGRVALYLRGKIKGKYLINALYDTAKEMPEDKLFGTIEPDKYYPVYGDSSTLERVGESQDKLYISIEREGGFLSYGSYETGLTETEFTSYSRTLQGIKASYEGKKHNLSLFGAVTPQVAVHDEIRGDGTSGYYRLSQKNIIEGSDKVVIEIREEDNPDEVIKSTSLERDRDYYLYHKEGMILFKKAVPSRGKNGNPVWIVIDYEYMPEAGDLDHNIVGVRGELNPSGDFKIGASFVSDTDSPSESQLYGVDIAVLLA